jgi:ATP-binding cassette, subfamily B, bacterial PglK
MKRRQREHLDPTPGTSLAKTYRRMLAVLTPDERRRLLLLVPAVVLMALLQVVGIGAILPFLIVAADPAAIPLNPWLNWAYETFGFASPNHFLFGLAVLAFLLLLVGNSFSALTVYMRSRFVEMLPARAEHAAAGGLPRPPVRVLPPA